MLKKIFGWLCILCLAYVTYFLLFKKEQIVKLKAYKNEVTKVSSREFVEKTIQSQAEKTLESEDLVNEVEKEKVKESFKFAIDYLNQVKSNEEFKPNYYNHLSITDISMLRTVKSVLIVGYQFKIESLNVFKSEADNVYQLTIKLVDSQQNELVLVGNFVINTRQIELTSLHGRPAGMMN
ncbi:TPA: hypothetical protein ACJ5VI_000476 [Streptococcus agalactiae]